MPAPEERRAGDTEMHWVRGTAPVVVALCIAVSGALLLGFSDTLNPVDAVLGRGAVVEVPDFTGQAQPRAMAEADDIGLVAEITTAFSLTEPRGTVIAQDPRPGERVREGSEVELVVSQGVRRVEMPDAVGAQLRDIEPDLVDAGIPVEIERIVSEVFPAGEIMSQDPGPGVIVTGADVVTFEVSEGPADRPVPEVAGRSADAAAFELGVAGLVPGPIEIVDDPGVPQGAVISSAPAAGEVVPIDTEVTLRVSAGPPLALVPDLVNGTESAARASLASLGFRVVLAGRLIPSDGAGLGAVFGQYPEPGTELRPGSSVTLVVGREPPEPPPPATTTTTTTTTTVPSDEDEDEDEDEDD